MRYQVGLTTRVSYRRPVTGSIKRGLTTPTGCDAQAIHSSKLRFSSQTTGFFLDAIENSLDRYEQLSSPAFLRQNTVVKPGESKVAVISSTQTTPTQLVTYNFEQDPVIVVLYAKLKNNRQLSAVAHFPIEKLTDGKRTVSSQAADPVLAPFLEQLKPFSEQINRNEPVYLYITAPLLKTPTYSADGSPDLRKDEQYSNSLRTQIGRNIRRVLRLQASQSGAFRKQTDNDYSGTREYYSFYDFDGIQEKLTQEQSQAEAGRRKLSNLGERLTNYLSNKNRMTLALTVYPYTDRKLPQLEAWNGEWHLNPLVRSGFQNAYLNVMSPSPPSKKLLRR